MTALSIMKLLPVPPARYEKGEIVFKNRDILTLPDEELRKIRGREIGMIFQEPLSALNPVFTVGFQIEEVLKVHTSLPHAERKNMVIEIMRKVGLPDPEKRYREYPHQLSGGMRQRIMIAMALIMRPELVIADEPTTALDVTIQKQILDLMNELKDEFNMSMIFISHDMGVISEVADRVYVMYAGIIVEEGDMEIIFSSPLHPYTKGLIDSIPSVKMYDRKEPLRSIPGFVPDLSDKPSGCPFHPRCPYAKEICTRENPPYVMVSAGHYVRCFLYEGRGIVED